MSDTKPETFKVVLVGDRKTGKSLFRDVYCAGKNQDTDCATMDVESIKKEVKIKDFDVNVTVELVDTTGKDKYIDFTKRKLVGAHGYLVFFDITQRFTYENVEKWIKMIKEVNDSRKCPIYVVGSRRDRVLKNQGMRKVTVEEAVKLSRSYGAEYGEVSAKKFTDTEDLMNHFLSDLYKRQTQPLPKIEEQKKDENVKEGENNEEKTDGKPDENEEEKIKQKIKEVKKTIGIQAIGLVFLSFSFFMIAYLIYWKTVEFFVIESWVLKILLLIISLVISLGVELGLGYSVDFNKKLELLLGILMIATNLVCSCFALYNLYQDNRYYLFSICFLISAIVGFIMYNQYVDELDQALNRYQGGGKEQEIKEEPNEEDSDYGQEKDEDRDEDDEDESEDDILKKVSKKTKKMKKLNRKVFKED